MASLCEQCVTQKIRSRRFAPYHEFFSDKIYVMLFNMKNLLFWLDCTRAYALPMSVTAWAIAFSAGIAAKGNVLYGIAALIGIVCAHLGANLFDDIIDYKNYLKKLKEQDIGKTINLKKGKCRCFIEGKITVLKALKVCGLLFGAALVIGAFFVEIYRLPVLELIAISGVLCLIYPKSGFVGLSEIIIGTIFSPLLFSGVYYVMTGEFSKALLWFSLSFAIVTVTLLYTDFFLDYQSDKLSGKKTIPVICGSKSNAYYFYIFMIFLIYALLFSGIHAHLLSFKFFIIFLSIIPALSTIKRLQKYIDKEIKDEKEFMSAMNNVQKFIAIFAILSIVSFL